MLMLFRSIDTKPSRNTLRYHYKQMRRFRSEFIARQWIPGTGGKVVRDLLNAYLTV